MAIHQALNSFNKEYCKSQQRKLPKRIIGLTLLAMGLNLTACHNLTGITQPASQSQIMTKATNGSAKTTSITHRHITVSDHIAYGTDKRQRLTIYSPTDNQHHPVLIFVYGGSWQHGKRQTYDFVGRQFAKAGYTTVVVDYRLAPAHIFPAYVMDTANAMTWVYQHIAQYGGNPSQLFVMGHSAGAFNVVSAVDDKRFWPQTGIPNNAVLGVIGLAGPYDYDFRLGTTQVAFPKDSTPQQVMPVYHIREQVPPHLLVTGRKDTLVYPQNADSLQQALAKAGGEVKRVDVPATHAGVVLGLAKPFQSFYPTFAIINAFMQQRLKQPNS